MCVVFYTLYFPTKVQIDLADKTSIYLTKSIYCKSNTATSNKTYLPEILAFAWYHRLQLSHATARCLQVTVLLQVWEGYLGVAGPGFNSVSDDNNTNFSTSLFESVIVESNNIYDSLRNQSVLSNTSLDNGNMRSPLQEIIWSSWLFHLTKFAKISGKYVLFDVAVFDLQHRALSLSK
jgi:hypothetical protein